jgi:hypothetical protein
MKILSSNGLTATLSEKEYRNAQKATVKAYLIDYALNATDEEIEFHFLLKE